MCFSSHPTYRLIYIPTVCLLLLLKKVIAITKIGFFRNTHWVFNTSKI